jgi:hypothetical protein
MLHVEQRLLFWVYSLPSLASRLRQRKIIKEKWRYRMADICDRQVVINKLFFLNARNLHFRDLVIIADGENAGVIRVENRATIIGSFKNVGNGSIHARKVEYFSSVREMFQKTDQYASGEFKGKDRNDRREIINQFKDATAPPKVSYYLRLAKLFIEGRDPNINPYLLLPHIEAELKCDPTNKAIKSILLEMYYEVSFLFAKGKIKGITIHSAILMLKKALKLEPDSPKIKAALSECFHFSSQRYIKDGILYMKDSRIFERLLLKSLEYDPDNTQSRDCLFVYYKYDGNRYVDVPEENRDFPKALEFFQKALEFKTDNPGLKESLSDLYLKIAILCTEPEISGKDFNDSHPYLKEAYKLTPDNKNVRRWLYYYYCFKLKKLVGETREVSPDKIKTVIKYLEKGLKFASEEQDSLRLKLSSMYRYLGTEYYNGYDGKTPTDAIPPLQKALELNPENDDAKHNLAQVYTTIAISYSNDEVEGKGNIDGIPLLKKAIQLLPDNVEIKENLSVLYTNVAVSFIHLVNGENVVLLEDKNAYIRYLKKATQIDQNNWTAWDLLFNN